MQSIFITLILLLEYNLRAWDQFVKCDYKNEWLKSIKEQLTNFLSYGRIELAFI